MHSLSQAPRLGGLHRASRVPFRGSYFTSRVHPLDATPQRLIACWYRRWRFPLISSPRFVAHCMIALLHALWAQQPDSRSRLPCDPPIALPGQWSDLVSITSPPFPRLCLTNDSPAISPRDDEDLICLTRRAVNSPNPPRPSPNVL
jgi:hypothetical protein